MWCGDSFAELHRDLEPKATSLLLKSICSII